MLRSGWTDPVAMAQIATPPAPDMYGKSLAGASILVIDDEVGMRHFLTKTFETRV